MQVPVRWLSMFSRISRVLRLGSTNASPITPQSQPVKKGMATLIDIKHHWQEVIDKIKKSKPALFILMCECYPNEMDGTIVTLVFKDSYSFHRDKLNQETNRNIVEAILEEKFGQKLLIVAKLEKEMTDTVAEKPNNPSDPQTDNIVKIFGGSVIS